jgi:hypothetical protein
MIRILLGFPQEVLAISGEGEVTAGDFRSVVWPAIKYSLRKSAKSVDKITACEPFKTR